MDSRSLLAALGAPGLIDLIGNTPLVPIRGLEGVPAGVEVYGKAEWFNPGGSVKDRAAWAMVEAGEEAGALGANKILIDATSGNTGIAYAWIGAARGFRVRLCIPANANAERKRLLKALGAELMLTDPMEGTDGAIREARRIVAEHPDAYFYPDQYSNPANWQAHYRGTAEEIWAQTEGRVTHLVAGVGTAGTLVGTARRLHERNPALTAIAVQPDGPLHVLEGLKHLPSCAMPAIYDPRAHQRTIEVESEQAIDMTKRQARRGLLLGWSAGAAVVAAERAGRELERGMVVAILPDGAERYLGDPLWEAG
ncbi:MAG: cysteine synthase family protein [Candidatus Eisenbacteria bacterium]|uniref:Cysteine synthase family protein n=1 Tax=Eiseniibacteriota bacterium TaxID=2212470 RepID=A0A538TQD4_UNCEI|nr:MAG: cysteine synthase family protein [Candidatus Eisenbacteria bacterium]